ncbi:aminoglycoside phosphotransferase family protein [Legionella geestiana]|uniref:aminoglycoside phosphotransferase family protein n=1 Tax=Legionella geestiana TaxID=45065 RepID=UPI00109195DA|nr:aminoglycoside phosphotransferase family protein [Legionella geestiana]QDQ40851.1 aminoglycoside phosphotransferase family protein [Legionella geestiana]
MSHQKRESDPALQWALDYLADNHGACSAEYHTIADTAWSAVWRITTPESIFFLKKTPPRLFTEAQTISWLRSKGCTSIPELVAVHEPLSCFLMRSCGDVALRKYFNGKVDADLLFQGVTQHATIQRMLEGSLHDMASLNLPDWRLKHIPNLYLKLLARKDLLRSDGLSFDEITTLNHALDACQSLCDALLGYAIPETLNHCDFHENNMVIEKKTGKINLIDWGETALSHPFFGLSGCLWNLTWHYKMQLNAPIYTMLRRRFITPWKDLLPEQDLLDALTLSDRLLGIYAALGYQRMYDATIDQTRTVQKERPGSIAGCLRSFLHATRSAV